MDYLRWERYRYDVGRTSLGVKDSEISVKDGIAANGSGITVGETLLRIGFEGYLDDLRIYKKNLPGSEIAALTAPGITGICDRDLISLGCSQCDYEAAMNGFVCPDNYKLCTLEELYEGGLHIARVNGWLAGNANLWHAKTSAREIIEGEKRMAICCKAESTVISEAVAEVEL